MSELLFKNFDVTRSRFMKHVEALDEAIARVQPEGFNNTIHWHVGHVLTVAEQFMFGFPKKSTHLPEDYIKWFASGTKPADWQGDIPSIAELTAQLKDQLRRIKEIPAESFKERLKQPFLGLETYGELANFSNFHEATHLGQMQAMKRVIQNAHNK